MIRDEAYRIGREALVNAFLHAHASTREGRSRICEQVSPDSSA